MNPGDRPRTGIAKVLAVLATAGAVATLAVLADTDPAGAGELERFASCEALEAWGAQPDGGDLDYAVPEAAPSSSADDSGSGTTGGGAASSPTPPGAAGNDAGMAQEEVASDVAPDAGTAERTAATGDGDGEDGTNVIVDGVDELDLIDRLDDRHALVSAAGRLSIVDLVDDQLVANLPIAAGSEITYDRDNGLAWVVGSDPESGRLTVTRVAVDATTLTAGDSWSTPGWLVDARRVGDRLYLVASDGYTYGDPLVARSTTVPFQDGPVACDQVLHPVGPSDTAATLIVELPATGALEPVHATEVVGSGASIHVTTEAAYLATPLYGTTTQTSFHRFDLDTLEHTGSGRVDGSLLNEFAMSDHDGHLRVAVTVDGGFRGRPIDAMPDVAVDMASPVAADDVAEVGAALNEIVVLDTDGALDVVGRTDRFGHPGETLHGIRFVGDTAYAVTFLQTDPFYVVDLADPARPTVAGEVQLPGFSSYLHPISDGLVAGFGPDEEGQIAVKLFDVSDPGRPTVVDDLALGDESPVAWDHHAFVDLGDGRFAVPTTSYREVRPTGCTAARQQALAQEEQQLNLALEDAYARSGPAGPANTDVGPIEQRRQRIYEEGCLYPSSTPESAVVVVDASGGQLQLVQRLGAVRAATSAERVIATDDGWAFLAGNRWLVVDEQGEQVADLELGPAQVVYPVDDVVGGGPIREG